MAGYGRARAVTTPGPRSDEQHGPGLAAEDVGRLRWLTLASVGLGAGVLLVYATYASLRASSLLAFPMTLSVGGMVAVAASVAGGFVGFLFGIPRSLQSNTGTGAQDGVHLGDADERGTFRYAPNTNLEQISDWLTKILVGVGLVQLTTIAPRVEAMAGSLALGLGDVPGGSVFALGLLLYFVICGFVLGYVWTRLFMPGVLRRAEGFLGRDLRAASRLSAAEGVAVSRTATLMEVTELLKMAASGGRTIPDAVGVLSELATGRKTMDEAARALGASTSAHVPTAEPPDVAIERAIAQIPEVIRRAGNADPTGRLRGVAILWVDDKPENNDMVCRALEELGAHVTTSTSTDDALTKLRRERYDVIISDIKRPEGRLAGFDMLEKLKDAGNDTPLLFFTRDAGPTFVADARHRGAAGLTNSPQELLRLLSDTIRRRD